MLRASLRETSRLGVRHALVIVPIEQETNETAYDASRFRLLASDVGIPFLHLGERFQQAGVASLFSDGMHLTARGHELAAERIVALLGTATDGRGAPGVG